MDLRLEEQIFYVSVATTLVPAALLFSKHNRLSAEYRWLAIMLGFSFLSDFINEIVWQFRLFSVNYVSNIYTVINPLLLTSFFYTALRWKRLKYPLALFALACFFFFLGNLLFIQKETMNSYSSIIEKLTYMVLSILYFYKTIRELPAEKIYHIGLFWIISALFVTQSAKLVLYAFAMYLIALQDQMLLFLNLHNSMSIVGGIAITYGVIVHFRHSGILKQAQSQGNAV